MDTRVSDVGVLDKAVAVLDALAEGPKGLGDLVTATGIPRATAHRLAVALEAHGMIARDEAGRFRLGHRLVVLGRAAAGAFPLAELARPALERLREQTGESVQLYVRDGDRRRCIASLDSPNELRTIVPVGALLPLDRGSAGPDPHGPGRRAALGRERRGARARRRVGQRPGARPGRHRRRRRQRERPRRPHHP